MNPIHVVAAVVALVPWVLFVAALAKRRSEAAPKLVLAGTVYLAAVLALACAAAAALPARMIARVVAGGGVESFATLESVVREAYARGDALAHVAVAVVGAPLLALGMARRPRFEAPPAWTGARRAADVLMLALAFALPAAYRAFDRVEGSRDAAIDFAMSVASANRTTGCDQLAGLLESVPVTEIAARHPEVHDLAKACVAGEIAALDQPTAEAKARDHARLAALTGHSLPPTAAGQLLQSPLVIDRDQRAELERRAREATR